MIYRIIVREYNSNHDVTLLEVDSNPEAIVRALRQKKLTMTRSINEPGSRSYKVPKYTSVQIVEK